MYLHMGIATLARVGDRWLQLVVTGLRRLGQPDREQTEREQRKEIYIYIYIYIYICHMIMPQLLKGLCYCNVALGLIDESSQRKPG